MDRKEVPSPPEQLLENELSNHCNSIYSLPNVANLYKTATYYNSKTELSDLNQEISEVTLGADKRRKLLAQEN